VGNPFEFDVRVVDGLFDLDRLDALYRSGAATGDAFARVRGADVELRRPLAEELASGQLEVTLSDVLEWAPEYNPMCDRALYDAGAYFAQQLVALRVDIRISAPDGPAALYADPSSRLNVEVGGRSVWHYAKPDELTVEEHERLTADGSLPWRPLDRVITFDLGPGRACAAPPHWPHWVEHPGPEPAISFEVAFLTPDEALERKVWGVNRILRATRVLDPDPPGVSRAKDVVKKHLYNAVSLATRRTRTPA